MFRYAASVLGCVALLFFSSTASAAPISMCTADVNGNIHCDLDMNGSTYAAVSPDTFPDPNNSGFNLPVPGWLVGYSLLLDSGKGYGGPSDNGNVASILRFHASFFDVFTDLDPLFPLTLNDALNLTPIDGTPLSLGQIVGNPLFLGAQTNGGIGLVNESPTSLAVLQGIFFDVGSGDSVTVQDNPPVVIPPGPGEIPEPSTLGLVAIGLFGVAARGYRARRKLR